MILKWLLGLIFLVLIGSLSYLIYTQDRVKIGVVRTNEVLESFKGGQKEKLLFENKVTSSRLLLDSIYNLYRSDRKGSKGTFVEDRNIKIYQQKEKEVEIELEQAKERMELTILNSFNSFISKYAEDKDYDLVLGVTGFGNILFAKKYVDVTEDVIEKMNNDFYAK
ncbi:MAG: OmpH family outer membrane protein [Opitutaceae bacterium]|nr:OmpH family outer membrane protein [Cytophagales bacterium]